MDQLREMGNSWVRQDPRPDEILNRFGFGLDSNASERKAVEKEPTQKERIKNYDEVLSSGKKNSKPKHLKK